MAIYGKLKEFTRDFLGSIRSKKKEKGKPYYQAIKGNSGKVYDVYDKKQGNIIGGIYKKFDDKELSAVVNFGDGEWIFNIKKNAFIINWLPQMMQKIDHKFNLFEKEQLSKQKEDVEENDFEKSLYENEEIPTQSSEKEPTQKEVSQRVKGVMKEVKTTMKSKDITLEV